MVPDHVQPMGRRARKALTVRQALFDAGLSAFERQPIGLVSVLDITEAADVAKGVFYLQFKSKDDYLLALWEEVQRRFLESLRIATVGRRSQTTRLAATVERFLVFAEEPRASARFWMRMSSFFSGEVGEPGHLERIRQRYIEQLAVLVLSKSSDSLDASDLRFAGLLDSFCWAVIGSAIHSGEMPTGAKGLIKAIRGAVSLSAIVPEKSVIG